MDPNFFFFFTLLLIISRFCSRSFRLSSLFNADCRRNRSCRRSFRSRSRSHCFQVEILLTWTNARQAKIWRKKVWKNFFGKKKRWELSFCHKLWFSKSYIFATQCRRPLLFQTMNSIRSNNVSLKYQSFTPSGLKHIVNLSLWQKLISFRSRTV